MNRSKRRPLAASRCVCSNRNRVETGSSRALRCRKWIASTAGIPSSASRPSGFAKVGKAWRI